MAFHAIKVSARAVSLLVYIPSFEFFTPSTVIFDLDLSITRTEISVVSSLGLANKDAVALVKLRNNI